jgi:ubiquinone/menaquinone biosynthesis C-methylase UbiE
MGEQIHVGGFQSSADLAERARIPENSAGVDLCAATGAGMRFLIRFRGVRSMTGVDATSAMVEKGRERAAEEDLAERISFRVADVCDTGLPEGEFDFVWGEDAWCYVEDKQALISEAVRLVKSGGAVAFTDWVEGPSPLSHSEANRFLSFMKFPSLYSIEDYRSLLDKTGLKVETAEDTGRFAPAMELYIAMLQNQLTYDGLKILGFDTELLGSLAGEMEFMRTLAHEGKIAQGVFVARKP